jgi:hypothetical protein
LRHYPFLAITALAPGIWHAVKVRGWISYPEVGIAFAIRAEFASARSAEQIAFLVPNPVEGSSGGLLRVARHSGEDRLRFLETPWADKNWNTMQRN